MKAFIEKIGGRKLILSLLIFIGSTLLVYFTRLDQESYFTLVKYLVLIYVGGNVGQSALVKKASDKKVEFAQDIVETITQGQSLQDMGGRKFLFVLGVYNTAVVLLLLKTIEPGIYVDISNWILATYVLSNVAGKAIEQGMTISVNKPEPPTT